MAGRAVADAGMDAGRGAMHVVGKVRNLDVLTMSFSACPQLPSLRVKRQQLQCAFCFLVPARNKHQSVKMHLDFCPVQSALIWVQFDFGL